MTFGMTNITVSLLGAARVDPQDAAFAKAIGKAPKLLTVLAYLVANDESVVSRERMAADLWPELPSERTRRNLSNLLWRLQKILPADLTHLLRQDKETLLPMIAKSGLQTDVTELRQTLLGTISDRCLDRIQDLYRGTFLHGHYDEWASEFDLHLRQQIIRFLRRNLVSREALPNTTLLRAAVLLLQFDEFDSTAYSVAIKCAQDAGNAALADKLTRQRGQIWGDDLEQDKKASASNLKLDDDTQRPVAQIAPRQVVGALIDHAQQQIRIGHPLNAKTSLRSALSYIKQQESLELNQSLSLQIAIRRELDPVFDVLSDREGQAFNLRGLRQCLKKHSGDDRWDLYTDYVQRQIWFWVVTDRYDQGLAVAEQFKRVARRKGDLGAINAVDRLIGVSCFNAGDFVQAKTIFTRLDSNNTREPVISRQRDAFNLLAVNAIHGEFQIVLNRALRLLDSNDVQVDDPNIRARLYLLCADCHLSIAQYELAAARLTDGYRLASKLGNYSLLLKRDLLYIRYLLKCALFRAALEAAYQLALELNSDRCSPSEAHEIYSALIECLIQMPNWLLAREADKWMQLWNAFFQKNLLQRYIPVRELRLGELALARKLWRVALRHCDAVDAFLRQSGQPFSLESELRETRLAAESGLQLIGDDAA
jgi:DNA-binding SARP family transcriptional activator